MTDKRTHISVFIFYVHFTDPHDSANVSQKSWLVAVSALAALVGLLLRYV